VPNSHKNMKKKDLLKQLHNLRNQINPDLDWQKSNREILLSQIKGQTSLDLQTGKSKFSHGLLLNKFFLAVSKPVVATLLVVLLSLGAYIASVNATKNSMPGDFLYNFKLASERVRVNLTFDDEKKTNLEIAFAERRLKEVKDLADKNNSSNARNVPLKQFQESIDNVKSSLAKLEKSDSQKALKLANLVDTKTKEYVYLLENQQNQNPDSASNTEMAITATKEMGDKALDLIVNEFESGQSLLSPADVSNRIKDRLDNVQADLTKAKTEIAQIVANKKIADAQAAEAAKKQAAQEQAQEKDATKTESSTTAANTNTATSNNTPATVNNSPTTSSGGSQASTSGDKTTVSSTEGQPGQTAETPKEEVLPTPEESKAKLDDAQALLDQAVMSLKNGLLGQAFDQIKQASDIVTLINKVIKANSQYLDNQNSPAALKDEIQPAQKPAETPVSSTASQVKI